MFRFYKDYYCLPGDCLCKHTSRSVLILFKVMETCSLLFRWEFANALFGQFETRERMKYRRSRTYNNNSLVRALLSARLAVLSQEFRNFRSVGNGGGGGGKGGHNNNRNITYLWCVTTRPAGGLPPVVVSRHFVLFP